MDIPAAVRTAIEAGPIAHVVTLAPDGRPQISMAWIGLDGEEVVIGTMFDQAKLRKCAATRGWRSRSRPGGWVRWVCPGTSSCTVRRRVVEGGAPETLQRLAYTYIGPGVVFPNFPNPPSGWTIRIAVERIAGSDEALGPD